MNIDNIVGSTLSDRYNILEKIGSGGMASVFKAKDTLLNRLVAIKILNEALEKEENITANFIKEAQAAAALVHNNVVSVYDVGEDDGVSYMVMELVDGITLKEYIKKTGVLEWQEACDFILQMAQGIGVAHASGIVHRDVKPQNIIMTKDRTLKVTDFGIARAATSDTTIVGKTALGSVHYISPEQARGGHTDARSDIYSLGIVLYEMLTGKVPFTGETPVSVALMHLEKEPVNVRCSNMDIPPSLAYVTMKAIKKDPSNRYASVQELIDDVHAVLAEEPLPSMEGEDIDSLIYPDIDTKDINVREDDFGVDEEEPKKEKKRKQKVKKSAKQKKEDRLATVLAFATILAIFLLIWGGYNLIKGIKGSSVPDLTNMTIEEAQIELEKSNLRMNEEIEYTISDDVEEGRVVTQDPEPDTVVSKGERVKLIVSIGASGGNIAVPDVEGKEFNEAITKILGAGLNYVVVEEASDDVEEGRVIRQLPIKGTKLNADDIVTLHVSQGIGERVTEPPALTTKVPVPKVVGMGRQDAINAIEATGLSVGSVTKRASDSLVDLVIAQSPEYPSTVNSDSSISIIVSSGPQQEHEEVTPEPTQNNQGVQTPSGDDTPKKTKTFTVKIPESSGDRVRIEITANGQVVHSDEHSKSEGYVSVEIEGTGSVSVQAIIDGSLAAQRTLNFD